MKKFFQVAIVALIGLVGYNTNAQESSFAVKAGINFNNLTGENTDNIKSNIGFHAGVTYELGLGEIFFVEPGLYFDTRGLKFSQTILGTTVESKTNIYGLTIPVLAKVKFQVGDDMFANFNVGPYANFGFSGKTKVGSESIDVKFGDKEGETNRFGFGLNFGAGVEYKNYILGVGYDLGLTETLKDSKQKFSTFKISVGYKF